MELSGSSLRGLRFAIGSAVVASALLIAACGLASQARAQSAPSWTGVYIGGSVGARWTRADANVTSQTYNYLGGIVQSNVPGCYRIFPDCYTGASFDGATFRIGPFAGINWQVNSRWVFGAEADWAWADHTNIRSGERYPFRFNRTAATADDSFSIHGKWDASLRARIGYLVTPSVMLFATGGPAWLSLESTSYCSPTVICLPQSNMMTNITNARILPGYTIGGGVEAMLGKNWTIRGEYRFSDFGSVAATDTRTCSPVPSAACGTEVSEITSYDVKARTHTALVGIAYRFDWATAR